jgi:hypothetical protein
MESGNDKLYSDAGDDFLWGKKAMTCSRLD